MSSGRANTARSRSEAAARRRLIAAAIATFAVAAITIIAFAKDNPLDSPREVRAVFDSAVQLRGGSAVRIAGIDVGRVKSIEPGPEDRSVVTIELDGDAPDIRTDAHLSIEPRLALEGNFYVKVDAGSPDAPVADPDEPIPVEQTDVPVQLDQVLNTFTSPTRKDLARMFSALGEGFGTGKDGGRSGARSLRRAVAALDDSLESIGRVSQAARGRHVGDLPAALGSMSEAAAQISRSPEALADLMTNYARMSARLAARDVELAAAVRGFDETFAVAPQTLPAVDSALDELVEFAPALREGLANAPQALADSARLLGEVDRTVRPAQLPRLLDRLRPATTVLPGFLERTEYLSAPISELGRCLNHPVLPALWLVVPDGSLTTGDPAWLEFMHLGGSTGGSSGGFEGNGSALRLGITEGEQTIIGNLPHLGQLEGRLPLNSSMNPEWLGYNNWPAARPGENCADQDLPDLGARAGARPYDWVTPRDADPPSPDQQADLAVEARRALRRMGLLNPKSAMKVMPNAARKVIGR